MVVDAWLWPSRTNLNGLNWAPHSAICHQSGQGRHKKRTSTLRAHLEPVGARSVPSRGGLSSGDLTEIDGTWSGVVKGVIEPEGNARSSRDIDGLRGGTGVRIAGHGARAYLLNRAVVDGLTDGRGRRLSTSNEGGPNI